MWHRNQLTFLSAFYASPMRHATALREDAHLLGRFTIIAEEVPQMSSTEVEIEMFVKSHAGARKRLAQEETKLAEQREKSKEKKVGKPFCQWREG